MLRCLSIHYLTDIRLRNAITQLVRRSSFVNKIYQKILVGVHRFEFQASRWLHFGSKAFRASRGKCRSHLRNELFMALIQKIIIRHARDKIAHDRCRRCLLDILLRHPLQKALEDV